MKFKTEGCQILVEEIPYFLIQIIIYSKIINNMNTIITIVYIEFLLCTEFQAENPQICFECQA